MILRYAANYAAPPAPDAFLPATLVELAEIRAEAEGWPDWSRGDQNALDWAFDLVGMGRTVPVARDEDGLYFATTEDQP